jgi:murein DD-endopeptidase MepM/ murein hydrolase activator NlpD
MAVPDTNTFTLQNVVTEVNPTTDDLVDCFADAVANKFDSNYSGSKNSLLNFRNYGAVTITTFHLTVNTPKSSFACYGTADNVAYHNGGANTIAAVGDTVYSNSAGTITYPAGTYGQTFYSGGYIGSRIVVDSSGVVTAYYLC